MAGFDEAIAAFILTKMKPTDFMDKKNYLKNVKKPFRLNCLELYERLLMINTYTALFPGSNGNVAYDDQQLKNVYFKMMLPEWQLQFQHLQHNLLDANFSSRDLQEYMSLEETVYNAMMEGRKRDRPTFEGRGGGRGQQGGRGRGRYGGRGGGRGRGSSYAAASPTRHREVEVPQAGNNCPFHPGAHSWDRCFANPHGSNYRPDYRPMPSGGGRGSSG
jgi:hypothetical protein